MNLSGVLVIHWRKDRGNEGVHCEGLHGRNAVADLRGNQGAASPAGPYTNTRTDFRRSGAKHGGSWRNERREGTRRNPCKWRGLSQFGGVWRKGRNGASEGIRTLDTPVGKVMLCQTELFSLPHRLGQFAIVPPELNLVWQSRLESRIQNILRFAALAESGY